MMKKRVILDGGMGTMLQAAGLGLGERPDVFGMKHPEVVERVQRSYVEAGSQVLYANTFGTNAHKLEGTGYTVEEVISANIAIAKRATDGKAKVALDVGPIGELLEPLGMLSFEKAYEIYAQVVKAGAACGVDLIIFETMTDLYEVKAAVLAAKENSDLPIWTTMSFETSGRTFTGTTVAAMALTLTGLGVDALGINCSLGPEEIVPLVEELRGWTDLPIIVKPNAGLPDPATGEYSMGPEEFGKRMAAFPKLGASVFGGRTRILSGHWRLNWRRRKRLLRERCGQAVKTLKTSRKPEGWGRKNIEEVQVRQEGRRCVLRKVSSAGVSARHRRLPNSAGFRIRPESL